MRCSFYQNVNSSNYRKGLAPCLFAPLLFVLPTNTRKQTQRLQETNRSTQQRIFHLWIFRIKNSSHGEFVNRRSDLKTASHRTRLSRHLMSGFLHFFFQEKKWKGKL